MNKEKIANEFFKHLNNSECYGFGDFDEVVDGVRISIMLPSFGEIDDFECVEVLDKYWDVDEKKSKELEDYLKPMFKEYFRNHYNSVKQQKQILQDRKEYVNF